MTLRKCILLLMLAVLITPLCAQQTAVYTEANRLYKRGVEFYEKGLLNKAITEFAALTELELPVNEPEADLLKAQAEFYVAKSTLMLDQPEAEKMIVEFVRRRRPDPITDQALFEVADFYFNEGDYEKALTYFNEIPTLGLPRDKRSEIRFKMGYAHFADKEFANAQAMFEEIKDVRGDYYYPTNYYLGLCYFFDGDYQSAIQTLRVANEDSRYQNYTPFYLAQIYFAEQRYDELIAFVEPKLNERGIRDKEELHQLLGQAYFEKEMFQQALPHLKEYAQRSSKLREEEFYQLGYTQYRTGNYAEAVESLKPLSTVNSAIGQSAMFYMADAYLKLGDKQNALTALAEAKRMNYDPAITEEALFNYGKLAYELNLPKAAINSLQELPIQSQYHLEAQKLIGEIAMNYRDYEEALAILTAMPDKNPQIFEAYQKVSVLRALQILKEGGSTDEAKRLLVQSLQYPYDPRSQAIATYWLGDLSYREDDYRNSINYLNQFITMAKTMNNLPDESSIMTANYTQGYNYFKLEDYNAALNFFTESVNGIERNRRFIRNENITKNVLGDATLRAGDCYFKRNQYPEAVRYYDQAVNNRYPDFIYALYQKAIIEGLRGRTADKVLALEQIINQFPNSEYADDALYQLGITYQEINQPARAIPPLRRLVEEYRTSSDLINESYMRLGLINYNQGNYNGAINYYKQVFGNNPDPGEAKRALAALQEIYVEDLGQPAEYFAFLETIPGYKVDNFTRDSINFTAAVTRYENGDYQRAIQEYGEYIRNFPNGKFLLEAHFQRGESFAVLRQYSEALQEYDWVIQQGPSRFYNKALEKAALIAYNHELDFEKAYQYYSLLEKAAPSESMRFDAQLGALQSAYRIDNAQGVFELANKVAGNPNATDQQKATAYFYLGKQAFDRNDLNSAQTAFEQVIRLSDDEQTAEARYLKAVIHYRRRELDTAQQITLNANKESSAYPYWVAKSVMLLSDILAEKGDLYNARAALEALLENYEGDQELIAEARAKLERINQQITNSSRLDLNPNTGQMEFADPRQQNQGQND